jgi:hypothetical protein
MIRLAGWVTPGRAQTEGGISGTVTDSSGAAIPGATVTVTNTATRGTRTTTTNGQGLYSFPALPPGSYELKVELQGFKTAEIRSFKVDVQQTVRVDVPLQVGALDETVTVVGQSTLALKPGDYMRHPKGGPHYDGAMDEDVWVLIAGHGPTKATVIDGGPLFARSR